MTRRTVWIAGMLAASLILAGCSLSKLRLPRVHKITVQQGNVITQNMVDQLKPGMTRSQVAYVMGEPVFKNSFSDDRWDYIYTIELPGVFADERRLSLFFEKDRLVYFTGDYAPTPSQPTPAATAASTEGDTGTKDSSG
jgi:outer membrane protein assembly factor BamE